MKIRSVISSGALFLLSLGTRAFAENKFETVPYALHLHEHERVNEVGQRHLGSIDHLRQLTAVTLAFDYNNDHILCLMDTPTTVYTDKALERMHAENAPVTFESANCVLTFLNETDFDGVAIAHGTALSFHRGDHEKLEVEVAQGGLECRARYPKKGRLLAGGEKHEDHTHEIPRLLQSKPALWTGCYTGVNSGFKLKIGIAVGNAFKNSYSNVASKVQSIVSSANFVYKNQLNIELAVDHLYTGAGNWNDGCRMDIDKQLDRLTDWQEPSTQGLWHLIDDCFGSSGNVAGIAYIGTICEWANTGVSYCSGRSCSGGWETFAHEIGHNFAARHSFEEGQGRTGGIMDYGDGKLNGIYQFNTKYRRTEICRELSSKVGRCNAFVAKGGGGGSSPTRKPTRKPTVKPTKKTTPFPSRFPTKASSGSGGNPTPFPSRFPTKRPTPFPTKKGSNPTPYPSQFPRRRRLSIDDDMF